eukprot:6416337-Amphidinium_carterae.1
MASTTILVALAIGGKDCHCCQQLCPSGSRRGVENRLWHADACVVFLEVSSSVLLDCLEMLVSCCVNVLLHLNRDVRLNSLLA